MRRFSGRPLRVTGGRKGAFNHVSLFCSRHHPPWWGTYVQQILDKCKRRSWTNTKRLLKKKNLGVHGQSGWVTQACFREPDPPLSVGESDRKFQDGDFEWDQVLCSSLPLCYRQQNLLSVCPRLCISHILHGVIWGQHLDFGKPDRLHFLPTMDNHSFCERGKFHSVKGN